MAPGQTSACISVNTILYNCDRLSPGRAAKLLKTPKGELAKQEGLGRGWQQALTGVANRAKERALRGPLFSCDVVQDPVGRETSPEHAD